MSPMPHAEQAAEIKLGHGQRGFVQMHCELPAVTRDALVEVARVERRTLKSVYNEAFRRYLEDRV